MKRSTRCNHRPGFTMVELLVVIVILALLIALLVPAIMGAVRAARNAAVIAEINSMAQALADFKNRYGDYPPSRIVLAENGDYSSSNLSSVYGLVPRSLAALRKFWPRMALSTAGPVFSAAQVTAGSFYDFNGNGQADGPYILTGPECLVFFLGGIPQYNSGTGLWTVTGFGKNPQNPMTPQTTATTTNRYNPFFEFNNSRLITVNNSNNPAPSPTGFPGYVDSLTSPDPNNPGFYVYFSAYAGIGYDADDYNVTEDDPGSITAIPQIAGAVYSGNMPASTVVAGTTNIYHSLPPNPYYNDVPVPTLATGHLNKTNAGAAARPRVFQNPQSFQILSPGADRLYGIGGQYLPNATDGRLPFVAATAGYVANSLQTQLANADATGLSLSPDIRNSETDNLTNFATSTLDQ